MYFLLCVLIILNFSSSFQTEEDHCIAPPPRLCMIQILQLSLNSLHFAESSPLSPRYKGVFQLRGSSTRLTSSTSVCLLEHRLCEKQRTECPQPRLRRAPEGLPPHTYLHNV